MPTVDVSLMGLDDLEALLRCTSRPSTPALERGLGLEAASERLEGSWAPNGLGVLASRDGTPIAFALGYLETWVSARTSS